MLKSVKVDWPETQVRWHHATALPKPRGAPIVGGQIPLHSNALGTVWRGMQIAVGNIRDEGISTREPALEAVPNGAWHHPCLGHVSRLRRRVPGRPNHYRKLLGVPIARTAVGAVQAFLGVIPSAFFTLIHSSFPTPSPRDFSRSRNQLSRDAGITYVYRRVIRVCVTLRETPANVGATLVGQMNCRDA